MNYLQLCQRLVRETGIADTGPLNTTSQTGDMKRILDWVNEAWIRLQSMNPRWGWMWATGSSSLTQGTSTITLPTTVESVDYVQIDGNFLTAMTFEDYVLTVRGRESTTLPTAYTIRPDGVMAFNTIADQTYTVTYDYFKTPTYFAGDTDAPALPERYHMLLVWDGLREYALFDEAPELGQKANINYEQMLADLYRDQSPQFVLPGALA